MGASIYYQQIKPQDKEQLWTAAPSSFCRSMEEAFGPEPWELDEKALPILVGMSIVTERRDDNPYAELIRAIRTHGTVKVWAEP